MTNLKPLVCTLHTPRFDHCPAPADSAMSCWYLPPVDKHQCKRRPFTLTFKNQQNKLGPKQYKLATPLNSSGNCYIDRFLYFALLFCDHLQHRLQKKQVNKVKVEKTRFSEIFGLCIWPLFPKIMASQKCNSV